MNRLLLSLLILQVVAYGCGTPTAEVEENIITPADSVTVVAGYDLRHLRLTEDDLAYAPQKMTKHHILGLAAVHCDSTLLARALADGANPMLQTQGMLPFFEAALCSDNFAVLLRLLLEQGADVNGTDDLGETALNYAISFEEYGAVDFLLEHGASLTITDAVEGYGCPPTYSATTTEMMDFLRQRGADYSRPCTSGITMLHYAVENDNISLIKYILKEELVDPRTQNQYGETAYNYATNYALEEAQDLLRSYR